MLKVIIISIVAMFCYADVSPYTTIQMGKFGDVIAQEVRFGVAYETEFIEPYIEHLSGLSTQSKTSLGMNMVGISLKSKQYRNTNIYAGGFYFPKEYNKLYFIADPYAKESGYRYGVKYKFETVYMYMERFNGNETVFGFEWKW